MPTCNGTGRAKTGNADADSLEHEIARLKWDLADSTEMAKLGLHLLAEFAARERFDVAVKGSGVFFGQKTSVTV
jgi:hypothetical protein